VDLAAHRVIAAAIVTARASGNDVALNTFEELSGYADVTDEVPGKHGTDVSAEHVLVSDETQARTVSAKRRQLYPSQSGDPGESRALSAAIAGLLESLRHRRHRTHRDGRRRVDRPASAIR